MNAIETSLKQNPVNTANSNWSFKVDAARWEVAHYNSTDAKI